MNFKFGNTTIIEESQIKNTSFKDFNVGEQIMIFREQETNFDYMDNFNYNDYSSIIIIDKACNGIMTLAENYDINNSFIDQNVSEDEDNAMCDLRDSYIDSKDCGTCTFLNLNDKSFLIREDIFPENKIPSNNKFLNYINDLFFLNLLEQASYKEISNDRIVSYQYIVFKLDSNLKACFYIKNWVINDTISSSFEAVLINEGAYFCLRGEKEKNQLFDFISKNISFCYDSQLMREKIDTFDKILKVTKFNIKQVLDDTSKQYQAYKLIAPLDYISFENYKKTFSPVYEDENYKFYIDKYNLVKGIICINNLNEVVSEYFLNEDYSLILNSIKSYVDGKYYNSSTINIFTGEILYKDYTVIYEDTESLILSKDNSTVRCLKFKNLFIELNPYKSNQMKIINKIEDKRKLYEKLIEE